MGPSRADMCSFPMASRSVAEARAFVADLVADDPRSALAELLSSDPKALVVGTDIGAR